MGTIADAFQEAYRDFVTDGVPATGAHEPEKSDIRAIGVTLETAMAALTSGGADVVKTTRALLDADLAWAAGSVGIVYADATPANNDYYIKQGASGVGSWTLTSVLGDAVELRVQPFLDEAQDAVDAAEGFAEDAAASAATVAGRLGRPVPGIAAEIGWLTCLFADRVPELLREGIGNGGADLIADWPDASGNGIVPFATSVVSRPTYSATGLDGKPCVEFNGTTSRMACVTGTFQLFQPFTMVLIGDFTAADYALQRRIFNAFQVGDGTQRASAYVDATTGFITASAGVPLASATAMPLNDPFLLIVDFNGASSKIELNGTSIASGDVGAGSLLNLRLGADYDLTKYWPGGMRVFGLVEGLLSAAQRAAIEAFAADDQGITIS